MSFFENTRKPTGFGGRLFGTVGMVIIAAILSAVMLAFVC